MVVAAVMESTAPLSLQGGKSAGWVCVELDAATASPWHLLFSTPGVAGKPQSGVIGKKFQVFSFADGKLWNEEVSSLIRKLDLECSRAGVINDSCS